MVDFTIRPLIVQAGCETSFVLRPLDALQEYPNGQAFTLSIFPLEQGNYLSPEASSQLIPVTMTDGEIRVKVCLPREQEYVICLSEAQNVLWETRLYAIAADLWELTPYKGDFHLHSNRSDGKESPADVAAAARQIGMDFIAITDHNQYAPSLEAIQSWSGVPHDLKIFPGEEIHPPGNPVHMINFGGNTSINAMFGQQHYQREVDELAASLAGLMDENTGKIYASCCWCYQQIRKAGGMAIWCHPYWYFCRGYNNSEALIARHFDEMPFDVLELIGGYHLSEVESNLLQVARYHEERARGRIIPILGASDAHGCETGELFGWYYTILFAPSLELPAIITAVKECFAVAVESLPGQTARVHGPFRLVKLAQFLIRQVFPLHDALCAVEGQQMKAWLAGDASVAEELTAGQGQVERLMKELWGRTPYFLKN